jgi:predicted nucleic acid-binding protein
MSKPFRVATGTPVVIDSSVAFKWFDASELGSDVAVELLREHRRDETALLAPAHLHLEVINTLVSRKVCRDEIELAIGFLADADLLIAPVDDELLVDAARIAHAERIDLYDATFIALASRLDAELVTADRRQAATCSCRVRFIG